MLVLFFLCCVGETCICRSYANEILEFWILNLYTWLHPTWNYRRDYLSMSFLSHVYNCGLRLCWECRERLPHHRLQRKPLINDPCMMHHGTYLVRGSYLNLSESHVGLSQSFEFQFLSVSFRTGFAFVLFSHTEQDYWKECGFSKIHVIVLWCRRGILSCFLFEGPGTDFTNGWS